MWYDEFAIGWNEIFDHVPPTPPRAQFRPAKCVSTRVAAAAASASSSSATAAAATASPPRGGPQGTPRAKAAAPGDSPAVARKVPAPSASSSAATTAAATASPPQRLARASEGGPQGTPRAKAAAPGDSPGIARKVPAPTEKGAIWTSEVLTSKKPPSYLREGDTDKRGSAIESGIKEKMLVYPVTQLRKPAEVVEAELKQLRTEIGDAHSARRRASRRDRRLAMRGRVKPHEDLDFLHERLAVAENLSPLSDPAEEIESWKPTRPTAKVFFVQLGNRHIHGEHHQASPSAR